jgi:hypothetical protein
VCVCVCVCVCLLVFVPQSADKTATAEVNADVVPEHLIASPAAAADCDGLRVQLRAHMQRCKDVLRPSTCIDLDHELFSFCGSECVVNVRSPATCRPCSLNTALTTLTGSSHQYRRPSHRSATHRQLLCESACCASSPKKQPCWSGTHTQARSAASDGTDQVASRLYPLEHSHPLVTANHCVEAMMHMHTRWSLGQDIYWVVTSITPVAPRANAGWV